ncbi:hypothetical protein ACH5RR_013618 [Cinchona calisaya]|uniref:Myb/SANT-like domain-containing protein n=1 Tax=Cinchona calisaya TaxID=153742 RepID=A0ABD3A0J3_9GENT
MASRSTRSRRAVPVQQPESQSRAKWTSALTKILVDLLVDQVRQGNKRNKSFDKKAWECVCEDFREKTGLKWDNEQLKSRYTALRKQYVIVKSLLDHGDFKWDQATGVIVATDEAWDGYIKEHPDAETVRSSGCPMYKQLCTIFSLPGTRGKYNQPNGSYEHGGGTLPISDPQPLSVYQEGLSNSESEQGSDTADERENLQSIVPSRVIGQKRGRKGIDGVIAKAILQMAAASKLRAAAIKKFNERYSITDCVKALDELQGVSDQIYYAALDLFNNHVARETFLSLKVDKRLTWLSAKCLGPTNP